MRLSMYSYRLYFFAFREISRNGRQVLRVFVYRHGAEIGKAGREGIGG